MRVASWLVVCSLLLLGCKNPPVVFLTDGGPDSPSMTVTALPALNGSAGNDRSDMQRGGTENVRDFDTLGKIPTLKGAIYVRAYNTSPSSNAAAFEISVDKGHVRGYLAIGNAAAVHKSEDQGGYRYVDATAGHPAKLTGELIVHGSYGCVLEAVDGDATNVQYHMWR